MRSILSALRQTGVLGATHPSTPPGALLPARRVPTSGLGLWDSSRTARELIPTSTAAADSFHLHQNRRRRRQQQRQHRLVLPAPAAAAAISDSGSSSTADVAFGDPNDQGVLANASGLQLLFLGTGAGPSPTASRGAPCVAVRTNHASWLFDCGDDTQRALSRQRGAAPAVRHGRIAAFFVTSRHGGGALGLPGMLCIASAARDVARSMGGGLNNSNNNSKRRNDDAFQPPAPASVSIFGPPGIAAFLDEMLTLSDTFLSMPVLVHEFGYGVGNENSADDDDDVDDVAVDVAPSPRGAGAVPVPRLLSRRAKLSVATLLPDALNPLGFYDLEPAPKAAAGNDGDGQQRRQQRGQRGRPGRRGHGDADAGFGDGVDARSGVRGPSCLPAPVSSEEEIEANRRALREDPSKATWTLRFDNEYVVKCVPLVATVAGKEDEKKEKKKATTAAATKKNDDASLSSSSSSFSPSSGPDALAYVIRESARAGKIDAEKAESLGVRPGPMMAELKAGKAVTVTVAVDDGVDDENENDGGGGENDGENDGGDGENRQRREITRVVQPEEVVAPDVPGRVVAVLGDPLPPRSDTESLFFFEERDGSKSNGDGDGNGDDASAAASAAALAALSSALAREAPNADLVVAGASAAAAAAEAAERAGAAALVLTRFGVAAAARGARRSGGESGGESDGGSESDGGDDDDGGETRRHSSSSDADTAAEAAAVIAARKAAGPRLREKIAAARDLDLIVLSRRGGGGGGGGSKKKEKKKKGRRR